MSPSHSELLRKAHDLDRMGKAEEALTAYRAFLAAEPRLAAAWSDVSGLLLVMGRLDEAQEACEKALRLDPGCLSARVNAGCIQMRCGDWESAEGHLRQALTVDGRRTDARLALAQCLIRTRDPKAAEQEVARVIQFEPANVTAHQILGGIFYSMGRWADFQAEIERYRKLDSGSPYLVFEQGFLDLLFGEMPRGWEGHEARLQVPGLVGPVRHFSQPTWRGEPFPGKTLLLHYEQGLGDTLMFVRYAAQVKALGGRVVLEAQPCLADLVATCPGVDEVVSHGAPLPPFDLQVSLLSLPWVFRTDLDTIPCEVPYLDLPAEVPHRKVFAELLALAQSHGKSRIGLVWAGSPEHKRDEERSLPPAALGPLAALQGVAWFSFQLGRSEMPPLPDLISLAPLLSDFSATAYALSGMELVITVDTALAHLAGAMGIPTLLLLPYQPDWRWMLEREDSPWYPSMRIYRQPSPGDWGSVIQQVLTDLSTD
ncbi:MAG: glycosyl transferase family 9 [Holophagaceae bacterium]|nr:glycosyl transferase family 9 [Holophagaceae bacterium]